MITVLQTLGVVWAVCAVIAAVWDEDTRGRILDVLLLPVAVVGVATILALRVARWPKLWPGRVEPVWQLEAILESRYRPVHWRRLASAKRWAVVLIREDATKPGEADR